jgi:hypothetical protein
VLGREHRALLGGFRNQHSSLVEYLSRFALRHAEKDLLARTYLAIEEEGGLDRLAGYFSLATASVASARPQRAGRFPSFRDRCYR